MLATHFDGPALVVIEKARSKRRLFWQSGGRFGATRGWRGHSDQSCLLHCRCGAVHWIENEDSGHILRVQAVFF